MSLAIFVSVAASVAAASLASRVVDLGFTHQCFLANRRAQAMDRHNAVLEELLADPSIADDIKDSVCFIGRECFEKTSAIRFLNCILSTPMTGKADDQSRESVLVSEAIGSALDVAVTYGVESIVIPEKSRVSLMRRPSLAFAVAA